MYWRLASSFERNGICKVMPSQVSIGSRQIFSEAIWLPDTAASNLIVRIPPPRSSSCCNTSTVGPTVQLGPPGSRRTKSVDHSIELPHRHYGWKAFRSCRKSFWETRQRQKPNTFRLEDAGPHRLLSMETYSGNGIALAPLGGERNRQSGPEPIDSHGEEGNHGLEFSLPRADGGKDAWLFLAGAFAIEALVWGEL